MRVLVMEDAPGHAAHVRDLLDVGAPGEFDVVPAAGPAAAAERLLGAGRPAIDAVLLVPSSGGEAALGALDAVRTAALGAALVVLAADDDDALARAAVARGAQEVVVRGQVTGRQLARVLRHAAERQRRENALSHQALHDPLTGLPNRTLFLDRLRQGLSRVGRTQACLAVMFLDLDDFKAVNDHHGHAAGDALLVRVGERLAAALRGGDTAARIGGDEFVVLCEDVAGSAEVTAIAARLLAGLPCRASMGIALTDRGDTAPDALVREADAAMYAVKRRGGGSLELARDAVPAVAPEGV